MDEALVAWVPYGNDWTKEGVLSIGGSLCTGYMQKLQAEMMAALFNKETKGAYGHYIPVYKERI